MSILRFIADGMEYSSNISERFIPTSISTEHLGSAPFSVAMLCCGSYNGLKNFFFSNFKLNA
jgi:hypothetical protein